MSYKSCLNLMTRSDNSNALPENNKQNITKILDNTAPILKQADIDAEKRRKLLASDVSTAKSDSKLVKRKKRHKRIVSHARIYIRATKNNTFVTVTDTQGNVLRAKSAGQMFKSASKSTQYASSVIVNHCITEAVQNYSIITVDIFVHGTGPQVEAATKNIIQSTLAVRKIVDNTRIAYNGTRAPVRRTP